MASRKALGRGLSALIPPAPPAPRISHDEGALGAPIFVAVSKIAPNPRQPRKMFRDAGLDALASSIREQGILQPLVLRRRGDGYELIIGERRWRAAQRAGLDEVPAVILDATDRSVLEMALVENVQRADLNPMELARAFQVLADDEDLTQEDIGRRVGLDRSSVANHLRLLELPEDIQNDVVEERLSMGHAKAILQVPVEQRRIVRDQVVRGGLSVRSTEELTQRIASSAPRPARPGPTRDAQLVQLEDQLRRELRTKVRIVGRRDRGRLEVHYFGPSELDRIAERLLGGEA
jgi:ParB family chromosome partitioning protein